MPHAVLIMTSPGDQRVSGLPWVRVGCLPRRHPAAEQRSSEPPVVTAGVVDLIGLLVAGGDEGLVEADRPLRLGSGQRADTLADLLQVPGARPRPRFGDVVARTP